MTLAAPLRHFEVTQSDPNLLHPNIGAQAARFLGEIRTDISDGKLAIDSLLNNGISDIESLAANGYGDGLTAVQIFHRTVGSPRPYTSDRPRLTALPGESMLDFALRLRPHQDHTLVKGGHKYTVPLTCDGRYDPEIYQLDLWPVLNGLHVTKDIARIQDTVDLVTGQTLKHGYPFNGIRVKDRPGQDPEIETSYYAGRSQPPTYPYMIRLLGEHGGDEVYAHKPYIEAMERIWAHFNPAPEKLENQPRGMFHAFRRGGISPEGWPFSVYGDDTNNGKPLEEYIGRPESSAEDELSAQAAMARAAANGASWEEQVRVRADTLVSLLGAGESGHDMSAGRFADGKDLSYMNTTNIIPIELQCMLIDAAEVMQYSYSVLRRQADARGDIENAKKYFARELYLFENREKRIQFLQKYSWNPNTGTFHDVELQEPSGPYSSLRTYNRARQTKVITATALNTLYSAVTNPEQTRSVLKVVRNRLLGIGGLAVTDIETGEQWDSPNGWASTSRVGVSGPTHAAARFARTHPDVAEEALEFAEDAQATTLYGWERAFINTGGIVETTNVINPSEPAVAGEYPKDYMNPDSPQNFAMSRELVIELSNTNTRAKFERLIPVAGRFVVEVS